MLNGVIHTFLSSEKCGTQSPSHPPRCNISPVSECELGALSLSLFIFFSLIHFLFGTASESFSHTLTFFPLLRSHLHTAPPPPHPPNTLLIFFSHPLVSFSLSVFVINLIQFYSLTTYLPHWSYSSELSPCALLISHPSFIPELFYPLSLTLRSLSQCWALVSV